MRANLEGISGVLAEEFVACKACPPLLSLFFFFLFSSSLFSPPPFFGPAQVFFSFLFLLSWQGGLATIGLLRSALAASSFFLSSLSAWVGSLARSPPLFLPSCFLSLPPSLACRALALHRCFSESQTCPEWWYNLWKTLRVNCSTASPCDTTKGLTAGCFLFFHSLLVRFSFALPVFVQYLTFRFLLLDELVFYLL